MSRKIPPVLALLIIAAISSGCSATIRGTSNVTATTARLNATGRSECGKGGVFRFEYATTAATLDAGNGSRTPERIFGQTAWACEDPAPPFRFGADVSGLTPNTTYFYRLCGHDDGSTEWQCTDRTQFTTDYAPGVLQPITARGTQLYAGAVPFRMVGFNGPENYGANAYIADPTTARFTEMRSSFKAARGLGANTYRWGLQLFDFVGRNDDGSLYMKPAAVAAYKKVVTEAGRDRIYLAVVGNNVWRPEDNPQPWYDAMTYQQRWEVQAFFFRELAKLAPTSAAIATIELTNEPSVQVDPTRSWYGGEMGGYHFTQVIARGVSSAEAPAVALAWMTKLKAAIRTSDTRHLVSVGSLPFPTSSFSPANEAKVLDVLSVHLYPVGTDLANPLAVGKAYGSAGKPMYVGETSSFQTDEQTERALLTQIKPYSSGVISFYRGVAPDDIENPTIPDAVGIANTKLFVSMRDFLIS